MRHSHRSQTDSGFGAWVLTVSDRASAGEREDQSGPALAAQLRELGMNVRGRDVVPDERDEVAHRLKALCAREDVQLVVTTGGTGLGARDWTPEATREIAEREVPGLMELARRRCAEGTPFAALGRGLAVTRGRTLLVNLPGNPGAARETLEAIADVLAHAVTMVAAPGADCEITGSGPAPDPRA
jgi:molybdopterin adenylyltransferase